MLENDNKKMTEEEKKQFLLFVSDKAKEFSPRPYDPTATSSQLLRFTLGPDAHRGAQESSRTFFMKVESWLLELTKQDTLEEMMSTYAPFLISLIKEKSEFSKSGEFAMNMLAIFRHDPEKQGLLNSAIKQVEAETELSPSFS